MQYPHRVGWILGGIFVNILIENDAKEALRANLEKRNKNAVRLAIKGFGWGGPTFGVVLDEQTDNDDVQEIDGIKFVAEKDISFVFDGVKIIYKKGVFGDFFDVYNPNGGGSC